MDRGSPGVAFLSLLLLVAISCSAERCNEPLVAQEYSSSMTASSYYSYSYSPSYGKLHSRGGWSPQVSDRLPWLQINLSQRSKITAIATQGTYNSYDWVTKYLFLYGDRPDNWTPFYQQGHNWTFAGNRNSDDVVRHELWRPVLARSVRFVALGWNVNRYVGLRVEVYGCYYDSDMVSFDGNSSLSYQFQDGSTRTLFDSISFNFKTMAQDGLLLHSEGEEGDYITVELQGAKLLFHINLGSSNIHSVSGDTSIKLGSLLDDQHWHMVFIERYGQDLNVTLDGHVERLLTNGDFDHLDLNSVIVFGGLNTTERLRLVDKPNFQGCMENIMYNNISVIDLARARYSQTQTLGNVHFRCHEFLHKDRPFYPITFATQASFIQVPGIPMLNQLSVNFSFRSLDTSGLLLFSNFSEGLGWLEMGLSEGQINISFQQTGKKRLEFAAGSNLTDGHWHSVQLLARMDSVVAVIDERDDSPIRIGHTLRVQTGDQYYFGGCPTSVKNLGCFSNVSMFHGCMQHIHVDNYLVDLELVKRRQLGRYAEMLFNTCGVADRCTPNLCEHEGICLQTSDNFVCDCERTGYTGPTCHNSLYPESCEGYRKLGVRTSGNYTIDPDGSGPSRPFTVHCRMTEKKAWTIVYHQQQQEVKVTGSTLEKPFVGHIQYYNNTEEEISAITLAAEYCEQGISFSCYRSRLLNSPSGLPFSWWLGRGFEKHFYWGGATPGSQRCACGMEKSCTDPKYFCNCDADYRQWKTDRGFLTYREDLPVTKVVVGDTNRSSSEARFTVGALRCYGDGGSWNTASFVSGNYLQFPSFNPGPSADISLYFKTTTSHGVFLENSGYRNFIRLELKSEMVVAFSFDVGDGPEELQVESETPLNDDAWHFLEAEINVKFARLRLDESPWRLREAPPQSYVSLKLDRPLFIGAAEYRLNAFFGCLRGLRMNGVILNLEKEANVTEGVNAGCVGECGSTGVLCQNGGRCVERYSTYSCDCNSSAFDGMYCHKVIGGYFEPGTYVRYGFQTPFTAAAGAFANMMVPISHGFNSTSEEIVFSFKTSQTPSVLMYISSFSRDYLAVIIKHDEIGVLDPEIQRFNSPGFTGCLAGVNFNGIAPLKAALRTNTNQTVEVLGDLVESNCGAVPIILSSVLLDEDPWALQPDTPRFGYDYLTGVIIGVIVALILFAILALLVLLFLYYYRHKGSYHTNEAKPLEPSNGAKPVSLKKDQNLPQILEETKTE
ncbi:contactin-associated protein 1 isoform X3 [Stegostoma tigrinum]|uniref:contactin-associated protein 1 isoform X3 n=1 Tax=Stegostoma tigrinum TaxID=3053191 RepID=UPI0028701389|nr:contactin-associated protein 1 isoform X3 [Stegostoma tigrinum]